VYLSPRKTLGDVIVLGVVCTGVAAMGLLMLLFPSAPIPESPDAYRPVHGVLKDFKDVGGYRGARVEVELAGDPNRYASVSPAARESAWGWQAGRTTIEFFILVEDLDADGRRGPLEARGLTVDGRELRSLRQDIDYRNGAATGWPAAIALGMGIIGLMLAIREWRQLPPRGPTQTPAIKRTRRPRRKRGRR
jgi:hypothetical protein